jgi:dienelactone hydrolase
MVVSNLLYCSMMWDPKNRRLSDILDVLSSKQPKCPQLYIYSSADRVIPAKSVELFIEKQRKAGHVVRSCNFVSSPHVDHFRNHPTLYTTQLTQFLEDCLLQDCHGGKSN